MLDPLEALILFVFGTILGSFLNALAFRYQSGRSMWGRSSCMTCNRTLEAVDLVPILSYIFLRGKCRRCKARIAIQYPIVEMLAGVITVLSYAYTMTPTHFLLVLTFFQLLLFIAVYDLRHKIIPDTFVYATSVVALLYVWASAGFPRSLFLLDPYVLIAGPALALPLAAIWYFSRGRAMGLGDAKLFLAVGWFLGLSAGFTALVYSFWLGALVGILLLVASRTSTRGFTMKSEIPFGPFIILCTALVYFAHLNFTSILLLVSF